MFAEAIFWREMTESARHKRLYWAFVTYLGLVFLALAATWVVELGQGQAVSQNPGIAALRLLFACQCGAALLFGPVWVAGALVQEKERDTYWTLFLSKLSVAEIVLGKLFARLTPLLLLLLSGLPIMIFVMDLTRLALLPLVAAFALVAGALLLAGGVGVCFGAFCTSLYAAVFLSYCFLALLLGGLLSLTAISGIAWYAGLTPFVAISRGLAAGSPAQLLVACGPSVLFCASACAVMCGVAMWTLYQYTPEGRAERRRWTALRIDMLFDRVFPTLWRFGMRRPDSENADAIVWREASFSSSGAKGAAKITFCLAMVAASVGAVVFPASLGHELALTILAGAMLFLAAHVTLMASLSVSRDLERRTRDLLLMLPLGPQHMVRSQFRGVLAGMALPMAFLAGHCATLACVGLLAPLAAAVAPVVLWMALWLYAAMGMTASLNYKTQARSALGGLVYATTLTLGLVMFASCCGFLHEDTINAMVRPHGPGAPWWRPLVLIAAAAIWSALAELATQRVFRGVVFRFDRTIYERD